MKNLLIICLFAGALFSCEREKIKVKNPYFSGFYKIKSAKSSIHLDLNNDGLTSNDILSELLTAHVSVYSGEKQMRFSNGFGSYAQVRPNRNGGNFVDYIDLNFPIQRFIGTDNVAPYGLDYWSGFNGFEYEYLDNQNISVINTDYTLEFNKGRVTKLTLIGEDSFTANIELEMYDFKDRAFKTATLTVNYLKSDLSELR